MYKWFYSLLKRGKIKLGETIWVLSYTDEQGKNLIGEASKFNSVTGKNPAKDFNLVSYCYAGLPVNTYSLPKVCAYDEIDTALSAKFSKNISTEIPCRLGMTGTNTANANVYADKIDDELRNQLRQSDAATKSGKITDFVNKGQLLEILCPVVYTYTREQGLEEGLASPMKTTVINHTLDNSNSVIKLWKSYDTLVNERVYWDKKWAMSRNWKMNKFVRANVAKSVLPKFLWNLPSKRHVLEGLLDTLEGQTILFGWQLPLLCMVTDNVVMDKNTSNFTIGKIYYTSKKSKGKTVYQKKHLLNFKEKTLTKEEYKLAKEKWKEEVYQADLLDRFKAKEINLIASSKAIGRGISPGDVDNIILASYPSTEAVIEQWFGRSRYAEDKITNTFIIRTLGTYEEKWFEKFQKIHNYKGDVERTFDLGEISEVSSFNYLKR